MMTLARMTRRCDELLERGRHYKRRRRSRLVSSVRAVVMTTRDGAGLNFLCAGWHNVITTTTTICGRRLHVTTVL